MYRQFIAGVAAASIAITAIGAVPAHAGDRELARALAAVLGVAVVGAIIHESTKDREPQVTRGHSAPVYQPPRVHRRDDGRDDGRSHGGNHRASTVAPRPIPDRVRRADNKLLPGHCFRSYESRQGPVRMFGRRCLEESYRFAGRLPQYCAQSVRTRQGPRSGYEARCLRDAGYRLARG